MRIGELSAATGTTPKTLRFYEAAGLLPAPARTDGGYRDYDPPTVDRVLFIRRGRAAGLTVAQIRDIVALRDAGTAPCQHVQKTLAAQLRALDQQIAVLTALRGTVAQLCEHAEQVDPSSCDPASVCRYI